MTRKFSYLAALSIAALLGVASAKSASAFAVVFVTPQIYTVNPGGSVIITGQTFTNGTQIGVITVTGLPFGWTYTGYAAPGAVLGPLATLFAPANATPGTFTPDITFTTTKGTATGEPDVTVEPDAVPEPGAVAFGVLTAGSLIGLVVRKRRKA